MTFDEDRYAGVVSRGAAFVVDAFIVVMVTVGCLVGVEVVGLALAGVWPRVVADASPSLLTVVPTALLVLYCTAFWTLGGRTLGMALLGLRVSRTDGRAVTWGRALVRALTLTFLSVGFLWSLVDARRQAVHDKLAGTVVVYDSIPPRLSPSAGEDQSGTVVAASPAARRGNPR
jgi:uncharacterized RDD family membrane protein YckC